MHERTAPWEPRAPSAGAIACLLRLLVCAMLAPTLAGGAAPGPAHPECGDAHDSLAGPYDYRTMDPKMRREVEEHHFTPQVQMLMHGESTRIRGVRGVGRDISYTLHLMPNHPQALLAMMRLAEREKTLRAPGARYPVACYFERAIGFVPNDYNVRVLYGVYLAKNGDPGEARKQLEAATQHAPNDASVQYNAGLAYFDLKDFDKAREHARRAYSLGFELPGLRRKLEAQGKWAPPG
jgi:tetratricopeptide (TPR) repeat protein